MVSRLFSVFTNPNPLQSAFVEDRAEQVVHRSVVVGQDDAVSIGEDLAHLAISKRSFALGAGFQAGEGCALQCWLACRRSVRSSFLFEATITNVSRPA